jgi:hypothetical protein
MSLLSESLHELEAMSLEKILKKAIRKGNKEIINFLRDNIYPRYVHHIGYASQSYKENPKIKEYYRGNKIK